MKTKPIAWAALILTAALVSGVSAVAIDRTERAVHAWSARVHLHLVNASANAVVKTIVGAFVGCAKS